MKVFVAGSTGVLGRRLIHQLSARGHEAVGLVRSRAGEQLVASLGGQPRYADLFDTQALIHAAEGADVVIHAATAIPTMARPKPADWAMNDRIRREGTQALADCVAAIGAKQFLFQSIAWIARPKDDAPFDESSPVNPDPNTQSAVDGERISQQVAGEHGFACGILRCGWFYGADSAHMQLFARELKRRRLPIMGRGDAIWRLLHVDDAASAFVATAETGPTDRNAGKWPSGLWHVVDDQAVTSRDFLLEFAHRLGAPRPMRIPLWLARLLAGRESVEFLTRSTRTECLTFRELTGWRPKFPTYREGLAQMVAELLQSGDSGGQK